MLGGIGGKRRRGWQRLRCLGGITDSMDMSQSELREFVMDREGVAKSRTWLSDLTDLRLLDSRAYSLNHQQCSFTEMYHFPTNSDLNSCSLILHLYCHWGPWKLQLNSLQWRSFVSLALSIRGSLVLGSWIRTSLLGLHSELQSSIPVSSPFYEAVVDSVRQANFLSLKVQVNLAKH